MQQSRSSERAIEETTIDKTTIEETAVERIVDEEIVGEAEEAENYNLVGNSTCATSAKKNKAKSHKDVAEQQMATAFNKLTNVLTKRKPETPHAEDEDECDLYAKLLAKRIRELPKRERQITMYEIDGLLIKKIQQRSFARETPSQYSFPYSTASSTSSGYIVDNVVPSNEHFSNSVEAISDESIVSAALIDACQNFQQHE